jgi:hypothetical protein
MMMTMMYEPGLRIDYIQVNSTTIMSICTDKNETMTNIQLTYYRDGNVLHAGNLVLGDLITRFDRKVPGKIDIYTAYDTMLGNGRRIPSYTYHDPFIVIDAVYCQMKRYLNADLAFFVATRLFDEDDECTTINQIPPCVNQSEAI